MSSNGLKFVFFGSDALAKLALETIRKRALSPTLIVSGKVDEAVKEKIKKAAAPVAILASYGKLLRQDALELFPFGILNIHPSMLPLLRGPSPIKSAILENLEVTGTSIMLLSPSMDEGPILVQEEISLSPRLANADELAKALFEKGAELLARVLPDYLAGKLVPEEQGHARATYCRKFKPEDAFLPYKEWDKRAEEFERKVRALSEEPGTYTILEVKRQSSKVKTVRVKILKAHVELGGQVTKFVPDVVQPEGKRPMDWASFLRGNPLI